MKFPPIALGSLSPRRLQLLESLDLTVRVLEVKHKEEIDGFSPIEKIPADLARAKSLAIRDQRQSSEILLTADTVVILEGRILHKPKESQEAKSMLHALSNKWHEVITGVCLFRDNEIIFSERTRVHMTEISPQAIEYYVDKFKPYDKAGAYGIQEWIGWSHVDRIEGSFANVMGLPTQRVYHELMIHFQ